jgi:hypothetical protein
MGKRSNNRSKGSKDNEHVRIKSAFAQNYINNTALTASNIGYIGTDNTASILLSDINIQSLTDMFRLFKVNKISFHFGPATGVGTASVEVPAGFLLAVPFGTAANPTDILSAESPLVSVPTVPFGTSTTTTPPLTRECSTTLSLENADLPVLDGPGGGWLATQQDGAQDNYGALWWLSTVATAANTMNYLLRTYFDISFKDLLDPSLISELMGRHRGGLPSHWELKPGTLLHSVNQASRQGIKRQPVSSPQAIMMLKAEKSMTIDVADPMVFSPDEGDAQGTPGSSAYEFLIKFKAWLKDGRSGAPPVCDASRM